MTTVSDTFFCVQINKGWIAIVCLFLSLPQALHNDHLMDCSHTLTVLSTYTLLHTLTHTVTYTNTHTSHTRSNTKVYKGYKQPILYSVCIYSHTMCTNASHVITPLWKAKSTTQQTVGMVCDRDIFHVDGSDKHMRGSGRGRDGKGRGGGGGRGKASPGDIIF